MFVVSFFGKCFTCRLPTSNENRLVSKNSEDLIDQRCQHVLICASRLKSSSLTQYKLRIKTKIHHIAKRRRKLKTMGLVENIENSPISFSDLEMRLEALKYSNECLRKQNILLLNFCKKYDIIQ